MVDEDPIVRAMASNTIANEMPLYSAGLKYVLSDVAKDDPRMEKSMHRPSHCCLLSFITMSMLTGVFSVTNRKYLVLMLSSCWSNLRVQIESGLRLCQRLPVSETKCNRDHVGLGVFLHNVDEYTHATLYFRCMV